MMMPNRLFSNAAPLALLTGALLSPAASAMDATVAEEAASPNSAAKPMADATAGDAAQIGDATGAQSPASSAAPALPETTSQANAQGIADIVVTAERRSQNIQKSTLSIQVLPPTELARQGVVSPTDLTKAIPALQVANSGNPQFYIRGVGDFGVTAVTSPAVSVYLDNVYISRPPAVAGNFFDLERVEVLKGPQGTLYGRNASGGVINLISARPQLGVRSFSGDIEVGNYDAVRTNLAVNMPLGSTLALRVAAQLVSRDGYLTDGTEDDVHQSVRGRLLWQPNDQLKVLVGGEYNHMGGVGAGTVVVPKLPGTNGFVGGADPRSLAVLLSLPRLGVPAPLRNYPGIIGSYIPQDSTLDNEFKSAFAQVDYDFGGATLTLLPGYRNADIHNSFLSSLVYNVGSTISPQTRAAAGGIDPKTAGTRSNAYSMEARLAGKSDLLDWVVGGFYFNEKIRQDFESYSGFIQHVRFTSDLGTESYAGFGQAVVNVSPRFRLQGGLRYTADKRTIDGGMRGIYPSVQCPPFNFATGAPIPPPADGQCLVYTYTGSKTFRKLNYKAGVEYDLADQNLLYANVSTGFKAGGFNEAASFTVAGAASSFAPETVMQYLIGSRNRFFDNRLQVNVEAFYYQYKNIQINHINIDNSGNVALANQNARSARVYGASADVVWKLFANGTFRGGVEYLNSKYTDFVYSSLAAFVRPGSNTGCTSTLDLSTPPPTRGSVAGVPFVNVDCSGNQLVRAPTWSGSASYTHTIPLSNGGGLDFTGDVTFASSRWVAAEFIASERVPSYQVYGAAITWRSPSENLSVTGFIRNITNEAVFTGGFASPFVDGHFQSSVLPPRTYGARLTFDF